MRRWPFFCRAVPMYRDGTWWFRIWGYGFRIKNTRINPYRSFSERHLRGKYFWVGPYCVMKLTPTT